MKHIFTTLTATVATAAACTVAMTAMMLLPIPVLAQQIGTAHAVDLSLYVGRWYEIARFPNDFEKQCVGNTTADYRVLPNNTIEVVNRCRTASGEIDLAIGEARVADKTTSAKLEVSFAPSWLSWIPWVWSDYWILDIDNAYSVATVGSPNRDFLWILARTPAISEADYESRVNNATKQGFDTSKLVKTRQ